MRRRAVKGVGEKRRRQCVPRGGRRWCARVVSECVSQAYETEERRCLLLQWPWLAGCSYQALERVMAVVFCLRRQRCVSAVLVDGTGFFAQGLGWISTTTPQWMWGIAGTTSRIIMRDSCKIMCNSSNDRGFEMRGGGRNSSDRRQQRAEQSRAEHPQPASKAVS